MAQAQDWHITRGSPAPEELAAVAVALSAALAARAALARDGARETEDAGPADEAVPPARWRPAAARRRATTSWTAGHRPGWRRGA
ncbi:hypothetical protein [Streptomyces sp. cmx-4-9]|uniref:hypothetical protein n=1 Tax=Streptomyces sp. cmx-4-9 TaxID=2790941 RepID=UPI003980707E